MKKYLYLLFYLGMPLANTACDKYDDTFPEKYHKIVSLQQAGESFVSLYRTGENTAFSVTIMKTGYNPSLAAEATLGIMSKEALEEYNTEYTALPPSTYIIENGDIHFQINERYKIAKVIFKTDDIKTLMEQNTDKKYVLPLALISSTDSVNSERNVYVMKPNIVIPKVKFRPESGTQLSKGFTSKTESIQFSIPLGMDISNIWNFNAIAEVINNTASDYLDPNKVKLANNGVVTFVPGENPELKITVDAPNEQVGYFLLGGKIDIRITGLEETQFDFDATPLTLNVTGKRYPTNLLTIKGNYTPMDNTTLAMLLDNNPATFMQTPYPNRNFTQTGGAAPYIQLDFTQPVTDFAIHLVQRNSTAYLSGFNLSTSTDGSNFTVIRSYTYAEMEAAQFLSPSAKFTSAVFQPTAPIKAIRITQTVNQDKTQEPNGRWQFSLADIYVYADPN